MSDIRVIGLDEAVKLLSEIVGERPDYVYEPPVFSGHCVYAEPGSGAPSCGVGHVLFRAAPEFFHTIVTFEQNNNYSFPVSDLNVNRPAEEDDAEEDDGYEISFDDTPYRLTTEAATFLDVFQSCQDGGAPWGDALRYALETMETMGKVD